MKKLIGVSVFLILVGVAGLIVLIFMNRDEWSYKIETSTTVEFEMGSAEELFITSTTTHLQVLPHEKDIVVLYLEGDESFIEHVETAANQSGSRLTIEVKERENLWFWLPLTPSYSGRGVLYVPMDLLQSITAESTTGDIELRPIKGLISTNIRSTTGDIYIKELESQLVSVHATTGDINIKDGQSEEFSLSSTTGDIELVNSLGRVQGNTTTGDILFEGQVGDSLDFNVTTGDIFIQTNGTLDEYALQYTTSTGEITVEQKNLSTTVEGNFQHSEGKGPSIRIHSTTGDAVIQ
ncbi:DUF4097 family beta strand repeat-containing protein [Bacillus coahuilensis]|uniref:DUF4097 family beta strand repeat-containing protein n=1 Tax=Bacillus coahuilensis TaxID=408580 RepID=UPI0001850EF5|nr:DUF4097 family beta strand repeat-containing protein [Bacillus coahuilensis]